jgi:hypothetical protein
MLLAECPKLADFRSPAGAFQRQLLRKTNLKHPIECFMGWHFNRFLVNHVFEFRHEFLANP